MRLPSIGLLALIATGTLGQTTSSVQNGDWDDPATWDCSCVPEVHDAVVLHEVRIAGNTFLMQRVHVTSAGSLVMDQYFSVAIMDTVINDGLMDLVGDIDVDWALMNNSVIHIDGVIHNDALLVMGGPEALLSTGDIGNYDTIEGEGRICVSGYSENTGTIHGLIDFCDVTPIAITPPFIDSNSGTVAGSVTFCSGGSCGPAGLMVPAGLLGTRVWPTTASDVLHVEAEADAFIELLDAAGKTVLSARAAGPLTALGIGHLSEGPYHVRVSAVGGQQALPIIVER